MAQIVNVIGVETKPYAANETRKGGILEIVSAVLLEDGQPPKVGEFMLPKDHPTVTAGFYTAVLGLVKTFEGKLVGKIVGLVPAAKVAAPKAA